MPKNKNTSFRKKVLKIVLVRFTTGILFLGALFFLTAGTFAYWEAWAYIAVLFIPMTFVLIYFLKNDPDLLERRMRIKEKEQKQKLVQSIATVYFLAAYLLPGLDKRFGWSHPPDAAVITALVLVLSGYTLFFFVLKENSYASRIVEVEKEQKVITTGPYSYVRHPMYSGVSIMYIFSPLALGSYWAMIPTILLPVFLGIRIHDEEKILLKELEGYREYTEKVKYRMIPGIF